MHAPFPKYVAVLLFSASAVTSACSNSHTASPTAPSAPKPLALTVEPAVVAPELIASGQCFDQRAFRASLMIVASGQRDFILRSLRFRFTDRAGRIAFPIVMPTSSSTATQIPSSLPISLPGTMTVPGSVGIQVAGSIVDGVLLTAGVPQRLPVRLEFGCATQTAGDLEITADGMTRDGSSTTSTATARVGS